MQKAQALMKLPAQVPLKLAAQAQKAQALMKLRALVLKVQTLMKLRISTEWLLVQPEFQTEILNSIWISWMTKYSAFWINRLNFVNHFRA